MKQIFVLLIGGMAVIMGGTFIIEGSQPRRDMSRANKLAQEYMDGDLDARAFIEKLFKEKKLGSRLSPSKDFKSNAQANTVRLLYTGLMEMGEEQEAKKVLKYASESQQPVMWVVVAQNKAAQAKEKKEPGKMAAKQPEKLSKLEEEKVEKIAQGVAGLLEKAQQASNQAVAVEEEVVKLEKEQQQKRDAGQQPSADEQEKLTQAKKASEGAAKKSSEATGAAIEQSETFMSKYGTKIAGTIAGGAVLSGIIYNVFKLLTGDPSAVSVPLQFERRELFDVGGFEGLEHGWISK